jgi:hypothetical protein
MVSTHIPPPLLCSTRLFRDKGSPDKFHQLFDHYLIISEYILADKHLKPVLVVVTGIRELQQDEKVIQEESKVPGINVGPDFSGLLFFADKRERIVGQ